MILYVNWPWAAADGGALEMLDEVLAARRSGIEPCGPRRGAAVLPCKAYAPTDGISLPLPARIWHPIPPGAWLLAVCAAVRRPPRRLPRR